MIDENNPRLCRIERMLDELRYEIERGIMENEIPEELGFQFIMPMSRKIPDGVVFFDMRMGPKPRYYMMGQPYDKPRLKLVSNND